MMANTLMLGAVAMASLLAALFFLRFWTRTRDRFFLLFAIAFGVDAVSRTALGLATISEEHEPVFYLVRLCMFAIILIAIIDKNWKNRRGGAK